ncbi:hypothetical protein BDZ94DRAFT_1220970 [Collybia nuda]|uniref:Protein kinase domain-containing protein n=1 Tax=Collybia nuda TaxID=64659 RepID=A0A9P5Y3V6_9AGAR|nr:hypothetical protein BDZ94DRAFT_1220970 [Collybia nuda]
MTKEMEGRWTGPMPVQEFLDEFLDIPPGTPLPPKRSRLFRNLQIQTEDKKMYVPFIAAISKTKPNLIPGFKIVNTSSHPDLESRNGNKFKPDPSMYKSTVDTSIKVTHFDKIELHFEFKLSTGHDPFRDPKSPDVDRTKWEFESHTINGKDCRGQLTGYATEWCSRQHLTFAYTILILGSKARLIRWDRGAAVVTEKFDYQEDSQLLVDFLWSFTRLDDAGRGKDDTVREADAAETKIAHEKLSKWKPAKERRVIVFTIQVNNKGREFIGWGSMADAESSTGRTTRAYPVWDTVEQTIRFLKDTWRGLNLERESEILRTLNAAGVQNVPELICGGDVDGYGHATRSHEMPWKCGMHNIVQRIHHHFVGKDVVQKLDRFKSSKDLMKAVYDAFIAHRDAYERCGILHRDVSAKNVMIQDDGRGFLNDWDLAKRITKGPEDEIPRDHERTGTWQFISTLNLLNPGKFHNAQDDMESFIHVVLYHGLRFLEHTPFPNLRDTMVRIFDDYSVDLNGTYRGGLGKKAMFLNRDRIPPDFEFAGNIPLNYWLNFVMDAVKEWINYEMSPVVNSHPTLHDSHFSRRRTQVTPTPVDSSLLILKDHKELAEVWEEVLTHPKWPIDDQTTDQVPPSTDRSLEVASKRARSEAEQESSNKRVKSMEASIFQDRGAHSNRATRQMVAKGDGLFLLYSERSIL